MCSLTYYAETKVLKQKVRDHIDPKKDLGHSDVGGKKKAAVTTGDEKQDGAADKQDGETGGKEKDVGAEKLGGGVRTVREKHGTFRTTCY
jgi:hypothetical protein